MQSFTYDLNVSIPSFQSNQGIIYYLVVISTNDGKSWQFNKRFHEYDVLHKKLTRKYSGIPKRPQKTFFKMTQHCDLERRKRDLENYSKKLLHREDLYNCDSFLEFFQIGTYLPDFVVKKQKPLCTISQPPLRFPITQIIYDDNADLVITAEACEEGISVSDKVVNPFWIIRLLNLNVELM